MDRDLTPAEIRVIGCLVEKERTTPDQYPLSTNALTSACNQKTSRDPVMSLSESDVDAAMLSLRERGYARSLRPAGSRAWKHRHVTQEVLDIDDGQLSLLAVLMLRGPQTPGELRTRTERMYGYESVEAVEDALLALSELAEPLVANRGRGPGQSQDRWVHLLADTIEMPTSHPAPTTSGPVVVAARASSRANPARQATFRALHEDGIFVMPNPWDRGSARLMQEAGFPALATTSSGYGRSIGKDDQQVTRDELVSHVAELTAMLTVPLNVDSEYLFPDDPGGIARSVELLADAGAAGCSIEDYDPRRSEIMPLAAAVEAVATAAEATARTGLVLTARAENHLYGVDDLDDTIERLLAFQAAGAEVLYAPGLVSADDIELVLGEIVRPLNVLAHPAGPPVSRLAELGVRRVSIGGRFQAAAVDLLRSSLSRLLETGTVS